MPHVIVGLGEVLWDLFPDGPRFGGAPTNFACHAAMLGAEAAVVSRVGNDELGDRAIAVLRGLGVETAAVGRDPEHATGTVHVQLDPDGRPRYEITEDVAWDHIAWSDELESLARRADAACFGTLAQRSDASRATIRRFLRAMPSGKLRILDVNLRPPFADGQVVLDSLGLADVVKRSDEELPAVAAICGLSGTAQDVMRGLHERYRLRLVALTRGADGAMLLGEAGLVECPGVPVAVQDSVGAGDAFTAAMTLGWLRGHDLQTIGRDACRVAAFVCTQAGATPELPDELKDRPS